MDGVDGVADEAEIAVSYAESAARDARISDCGRVRAYRAVFSAGTVEIRAIKDAAHVLSKLLLRSRVLMSSWAATRRLS